MAERRQLINTATESTDPRILRSRQMLMEALLRLLARKQFDDVSIPKEICR